MGKYYVDNHEIQPINPETGHSYDRAVCKPVWTNLHRDQAERDKRAELNNPKSWIHDKIRKPHGHEEFYQVGASKVRLIGGNFTPGSEDIRIKNQVVGTFKTTET